MNIRRLLCMALLLPTLLPMSALAQNFSFALIGDLPYNSYERRNLPGLLEEIGQEKVEFVSHDGDIKSGDSVCSDETLRDILQVFQGSKHPFIYVPGDNEWTDCHRANNGAYDPVERLKRLRELFFADDMTLGQRRFALEHQSQDPKFSAYRENTRWQIGRVLFVGLNVPGSNNNWGKGAKPSPEHVARDAANRAWLAEAFARAREQKLLGLVIIIQANPGFDSYKRDSTQPDGYSGFFNQLRDETPAFSGQVLLVHGDTHTHRIDQPLRHPKTNETLANFTRVETYGSPFMGWVKAMVDERDPRLFRFEPHPYAPGAAP